MRLLNCQIENFGKLQNLELDFQDGLNVFLRENGFGKSTLAAFIRVMAFPSVSAEKSSSASTGSVESSPINNGRNCKSILHLKCHA